MIAQEQRAYLLHSRPFKDNQHLVELLTENDGKVAALVYMNKSSKASKSGLLQPFTPLNLVLKGNNSLKRLSRVEAAAKSYPLSGDSLYSAMYLNELLVRLLAEHVPCEALYLSYHESLLALTQPPSIEIILRKFELVLLEELGIPLDFTPVMQASCASFYYQPELGFVPDDNQQLFPCYRREELAAIARQDFSSKSVLLCFKRLMRQVLSDLLGAKPLHSRKLFTKREIMS
ncbi:DNA repair protein RecO [Thalassomonas viridans]|uniref:DNA repair protein RecO n=1 Tax=Thalassomonas viridans TaxID=137584 RepID=A0AAF0C8F2_9GAMM|nr:DNA repair protein RecO [Thalassomonas viridans]WDE06372.1 DNA repair protein RecO [Thalassomonas viridans]